MKLLCFIVYLSITSLLEYIMPILILDDLRRAANNRKIPNADTLDFKQLLQALANQSEYIRSQTKHPIENQVNR